MPSNRCPYHVRQGIVDTKGKLKITELCGVKSACGQTCPHAPFDETSYKSCQRYVSITTAADRQLIMPKSEIEYSSELDSNKNFSDTDLL